MESIYIVGFMGAGKTTVGKILGEKLGLEVIDTDEVIETKQQKTVSEIFKENGEEYFRQLEHFVLKDIIKEDKIITTGGGIVTREENRKLLQKKKNVFYLKATANTILERLKDDTTRPLLQTKDKLKTIEQLLSKRDALYEEVSTYTVHTDLLSLEEVANEVIANLKE